MTISRITLQAHVQQSQHAALDGHMQGVGASDDFNDERLTFLDWLTEIAPAYSASANAAVPASKEIVPDIAVPRLDDVSSHKKMKDAEALSATESGDDSDDTVDPKKVVHLLQDALTPSDVLYLKQWLIPNLPIMVGQVPIQQLFPAYEDGEISYRGFDVSDNLKNLVQKGVKTGAPIRVELDGDASVVLKFKNGRVSAEFLSSDKMGAWMVKQQLETLKQQLLSKQLPVDDVTYRQQQKRNRPFPQQNDHGQGQPENQ